MFDKLLQEIQKYNSKANWANLIAGLVLLLVLAGGSVWYFTKGDSNSVLNDDFKIDDTLTFEDEANKEEVGGTSDEMDAEVKSDSYVGTETNPVVKVLPNTSSK